MKASLVRHPVAAGVATLVDFVSMVALVELAHVPPPIATLLSAGVGGVTNFTIGRLWTFRVRGPLAGQALRYALACAGGALLNAVLVAAFMGLGPYVIVRAFVAVLVSFAYTYPMHGRFVFRSEGRRA
jgi:putative flippase GtrA